jgi:hypothetical protein
MHRYVLVLTRDDRTARLSAAALGSLTGRLATWIATLRHWRLLLAVATAVAQGDGDVRGCLIVAATDLTAARRLAASCPVGAGGSVVVLPMRDEGVPW